MTSQPVLSDIDWSEEETLQILMALNKGIQKQQTGLNPEEQAFQEVLLLGYAAGPQPLSFLSQCQSTVYSLTLKASWTQNSCCGLQTSEARHVQEASKSKGSRFQYFIFKNAPENFLLHRIS